MNRRQMLAFCGLCVSGTAGCLSGTSTRPGSDPDEETADGGPRTRDDGPGTTDDDPSETPQTAGVAVDDIAVRKAVGYESMMGSGGVLAVEGRQYVVASVRASGDASESDFAFRTDSESWRPGLSDTVGAANVSVAGREGGPVGRAFGGDRSYLAFEVPSPLSASSPRIRFEPGGSEWPLPAAERDRLDAPAPRFELDSVDAPEAVSQGETMSISLTATNVSETDGRFLAAVYWPTDAIADDDESHVVERDVAAGDEVTASLDIDTSHTTHEDRPVTLSVRGHVSADREIRVRDASTPS